MCGVTCGVSNIVIGIVLVVVSCIVSFIVVPNIINNTIIDTVVLKDDSIQLERFKEVPFPLQLKVFVFNVSNANEVLAGEVPVMAEIGPYVYKLYQSRNITHMEEDRVTYNRLDNFEFDAHASFPYTEEDMVTIVNVPYHAIIQIAEKYFPQLVSILNIAMNGVFGVHNSPLAEFRMRDLLFEGIPLCRNPGLFGAIACNLINDIGEGAQNIVQQEDGSQLFSLLAYKDGIPSDEHEAYRGLNNSANLGRMASFRQLPHFTYWSDEDNEEPSVCNMLNGTDSGIFAPFVDKEMSVYAINTDICRSVEIRYQYDLEVDGIPAKRFSANEWFLDNDDGCFCLNVTTGLNRENGCLLRGAMELYSCVGAFLVLSYPHFLYADARYRNGVLGMRPEEENHRIYLDFEPNTGTPLRGAKRAQFNIFMRPVSGIPATQNLLTTLMPIVWIEESLDLPEEFKDELRTRLLRPLNLLEIIIPVIISFCCLILLVGVVITFRAILKKPVDSTLVNKLN